MTPAFNQPGGEKQLRLVPQEWDTHHFGSPVARLEGTIETDELLAQALEQARSSGVAVVYWFAEPDRTVSAEILQQFGGTLVRRRVEFVRPLSGDDTLTTSANSAALPTNLPPVLVSIYPLVAPTPSLLKLAELAGHESRFSADPRFSSDQVRELYHIWLARSTQHEISDVVFLAEVDGIATAGMITVAARNGAAEIGLLAVDPRARDRGVASALLQAVIEWGLANGLSEAAVVTYLENEQACRLYRRAGFQIARTQQVFHFWLPESGPSNHPQ